jgi:hypothetical protein
MHSPMKDVPVTMEAAEGTMRNVEWGGMTFEVGHFKKMMDPGQLFKGLPDDSCQCPHWGHVIKGKLRYRFGQREEVYSAGEVYYAPPGHLPVIEAGTEYVELSPTDQLKKTYEVVERNMASMQKVR